MSCLERIFIEWRNLVFTHDDVGGYATFATSFLSAKRQPTDLFHARNVALRDDVHIRRQTVRTVELHRKPTTQCNLHLRSFCKLIHPLDGFLQLCERVEALLATTVTTLHHEVSPKLSWLNHLTVKYSNETSARNP